MNRRREVAINGDGIVVLVNPLLNIGEGCFNDLVKVHDRVSG